MRTLVGFLLLVSATYAVALEPYVFEPQLQEETYNSSATGKKREALILPQLRSLGLVERVGPTLTVRNSGKELARFEDTASIKGGMEFSFVDISTRSHSLLFVSAWGEGGGHVLLNYVSGTSIKPWAAPVWAPSKMRFAVARANVAYQRFYSAKAEVWEVQDDLYKLIHDFDLKPFGELGSVSARWVSEKRVIFALEELISMQTQLALNHDPKWDKKMPVPKKTEWECVESKGVWKCSLYKPKANGP